MFTWGVFKTQNGETTKQRNGEMAKWQNGISKDKSQSYKI